MGLNYDLGDKSENLRRMNPFEKFNKAYRNYFLQIFRVLCAYFSVNPIYALYIIIIFISIKNIIIINNAK